jgi:capsular exopolysaccharide synthesis family protein
LGSSPDVRIIDRAVTPQRPLKDRSTFVILYGFGGSLGLVVLGVLLLDKLDRRVRFPEEVTHGLRLPILAAIPNLKNANGKGRRTAENTSHVIEAFRGLRMTLLQERGHQGCLVTAITSPGSGDGKSFISVNLAFALADQGYRTLLIDGDIRRGGLHHFLGGVRKPGLTDYLAGTVSREKVIQPTAYPLLDLLASGRRLHTGPELLGSPGLRDLVRELRSQYAVILIDTPPLGAGVDPFVLGIAAGNMVLVLRTGLSDMQFTEAKLNVLDRLPVRMLGAILNGVPSGGAYRYYGYIAGYESTDEELVSDGSRLPALS